MLPPSTRCFECHFYCKDPRNFLPTPPALATDKAKAILIGESPGYEEKWREEPFVGQTGKRMFEEFGKFDIARQDLHLLNRIACCPPANKKTEKNLKKASDCCKQVIASQLARLPKGLPRLYMGQ